MRLISSESHNSTLSLNRSEAALLGNVLNEFINGIRITEDELERRLGCGRSFLRLLHNELIDKHRSIWPDEASDPSKGPSEIIVQLTDAQLGAIDCALKDLASGRDIEVWEFPIRLGQEPKDALRLASEFDDVIKSLPMQWP
jgi:hypothetical protein